MEPTWAPTSLMVAAPSAIWPPLLGSCPSTVEKRSGPRTGDAATVHVITLLIDSSPPPAPLVIALMAPSCSRLARRMGSDGPPFGLKLSWNGSPYNFGVAVRCERLAPKTAVPHSAVTASTVPSKALPIGTVPPPLLRSSALRIAITALGGAPVVARRAATTDR